MAHRAERLYDTMVWIVSRWDVIDIALFINLSASHRSRFNSDAGRSLNLILLLYNSLPVHVLSAYTTSLYIQYRNLR